MNASMVERWNARVGPKDTIYLLGDFGFSHSQLEPLETIFARLNGHKHLVVGNHDEKNPKSLKLAWESVSHLRMVRQDGIKAVACHYPLETWASAHHGVLMLHGHSHGTLKRVIPHRFDVGVDVKARPVSLNEYAVRAAAQTFTATDHHGSDM